MSFVDRDVLQKYGIRQMHNRAQFLTTMSRRFSLRGSKPSEKITPPKRIAILVCENCPSNLPGDALLRLARANIRMITLPPHMSNLFQPLGLVSFGIFKRKKGKVVLELPRRSRRYQTAKVVRTLELAMVSRNNRAAFRRASLVVNLYVVPLVG
jgi:hypothetical protein